jgi:hypothetical protein
LFDQAAKTGIDKNTVEQAKSLWKQQSALDDLSTIFQRKSNVSGVRPDMAVPGTKGLPVERYNYAGLAKDLNALDPQRLVDALGSKERAQQLVTAVNLAAREGWAPNAFRSALKVVLGNKAIILGH